jgi:D-xylose transport system ATP-binding protein
MLDVVEDSGEGPTTRREPLLELSQVSKYFGGVRALQDVDLRLYRGEVVGLIGDNGAGKSTLVKVISGVEHPDSGEIRVHGAPVRLETPRAAQAAGIHTVYQDLSLCDNLDAVRNVFLGQEVTRSILRGRALDRHRMTTEAATLLESLAVKVRSMTTPVGGMSGGQRQGIAIARALVSDPSMVLLDEPTAALGVSQRTEVLELIVRLRSQNRGVLVISHDLKDVQEVADRVVVMRLGRKVAEFARGEYSSGDLIAAITGAHEAPRASGESR